MTILAICFLASALFAKLPCEHRKRTVNRGWMQHVISLERSDLLNDRLKHPFGVGIVKCVESIPSSELLGAQK